MLKVKFIPCHKLLCDSELKIGLVRGKVNSNAQCEIHSFSSSYKGKKKLVKTN